MGLVGVAAGASRLAEQTLGLIGFGQIGQRVPGEPRGSGYASGLPPRLTTERARELGVTRVGLEEIFAESDYVSLHAPANADTRNLVNATEACQA